MSQIWIDASGSARIGDRGFLIQISPQTGADQYQFEQHPARKNQSNRPVLTGWCGSWNNVSTYGCGMAEITRIARNGRALVRQIRGQELRDALAAAGYPDLA